MFAHYNTTRGINSLGNKVNESVSMRAIQRATMGREMSNARASLHMFVWVAARVEAKGVTLSVAHRSVMVERDRDKEALRSWEYAREQDLTDCDEQNRRLAAMVNRVESGSVDLKTALDKCIELISRG